MSSKWNWSALLGLGCLLVAFSVKAEIPPPLPGDEPGTAVLPQVAEPIKSAAAAGKIQPANRAELQQRRAGKAGKARSGQRDAAVWQATDRRASVRSNRGQKAGPGRAALPVRSGLRTAEKMPVRPSGIHKKLKKRR